MRVTTGSRLHFGLIDLNGTLGRVDGGVGLAIDSPGITLVAEDSRDFTVSGPLCERAKIAAETVLERFELPPVNIQIKEAIPQHVGLGSGTQISLAAGIAIAEMNDIEITVPRLAHIVGRGGTSGIGTAAFECGGFILDGGHDLSEKEGFLPSSAAQVAPPPVISRMEFPDWNIKVVLPEGRGVHNGTEVDIFDEYCPIPMSEVREVSHIILMKLLPSLSQVDFDGFREAVMDLQYSGFKRRELSLQTTSKTLIEDLFEEGYAAGLSSFGPAVYVISPEKIDIADLEHNYFATKPDNKGAIVRNEN